MAIGGEKVRQGFAALFLGEVVAGIGNRRPGKIGGVAIGPANDLDHVRIEEIGRLDNRVRDRGDVGAARRQLACRLDDDLRFDQRLVALHIDDDRIAMPAKLLDDLGQPIGAGRMVAARHQRGDFVRLGGGPNFRMVGRHPDFFRSRQPGAFGDPHDHRLAAKIEQRLGRQARRTRSAPE